jgi:hypothetical protein
MSTPGLSTARWRKSNRSSAQGGQCVEVTAARWRKSSHSSGQGGDCVEVADFAPAVAVRDSKDPDGPKLIFGAADWYAFTRRAKRGEHDLT